MPAPDLIHRLPRHLKMSELRVFMAVLEHRSLRKAAAALHLTQPALSKSIAGLEETLGVKLFDRVANGVELTVHGHGFAPRARAVFDELRRAAQELALVSSGAVGSLRVGALPLPAIPVVPAAVGRLLDAHPGVQVSLVEEHETELLDRLRRRDIELAILRPALVDAEDDLRIERLFDERACVVAARTHPLAGGPIRWRRAASCSGPSCCSSAGCCRRPTASSTSMSGARSTPCTCGCPGPRSRRCRSNCASRWCCMPACCRSACVRRPASARATSSSCACRSICR